MNWALWVPVLSNPHVLGAGVVEGETSGSSTRRYSATWSFKEYRTAAVRVSLGNKVGAKAAQVGDVEISSPFSADFGPSSFMIAFVPVGSFHAPASIVVRGVH